MLCATLATLQRVTSAGFFGDHSRSLLLDAIEAVGMKRRVRGVVIQEEEPAVGKRQDAADRLPVGDKIGATQDLEKVGGVPERGDRAVCVAEQGLERREVSTHGMVRFAFVRHFLSVS